MKIDEFDWEHCVELIDRGEVVPVLGAGLHRVETDAGSKLLYEHLGEELARVLGKEGAYPPNDREPFLRTVAAQHQRHDPGGEEMGRVIRGLWRRLDPQPSASLRELAGILGFELFVSTTFDDLMVRALNDARPEEQAEDLVYRPTEVIDLPTPGRHRSGAVVYNLLGRLSAIPGDYALSSEDVLEFLHSLPGNRTGEGSIKNLLNALSDSHLLLLGCGFSRCQVGYFMRSLTNGPLSTPARMREVTEAEEGEGNTAVFLGRHRIQVYREGDVHEFVSKLAAEWHEAHGSKPARSAAGPKQVNRAFISYASEDRGAVEVLREKLREKDIDAWWDVEELRAGSNWAQAIEDAIREAAVFIPCVSRNTESERQHSYFFKEWNMAAAHAKHWSPLSRYVWPVVFDDTKDPKNLPAELLSSQFSLAPGGSASEDFLGELAQELCTRNMGSTPVQRKVEA